MADGVNLGSAYAQIDLDLSGLDRSVKRANRAFGDLDNAMTGVDKSGRQTGSALDGLGAVLGGPVVLGAAAAGAALVGIGAAMVDIQASAAEVERQLGDLPTDQLQAVTADAEYLARAFDVDITESTRAARRVMDEFGSSADGAFHLLEQGQQRGLDRFGDLNDTLNEYSNDFAQLGMTGPEALARIEAGLEAGFRNTDVIGDALNEFNIRLQETGRIEALGKIDEDTAAIVEAFQSGAITSEQAFKQIGNAVRNIEDPIRQNAALVELFGTTAEDAGADAALALLAPRSSLLETMDAISEGERQYGSFGALWADVSSRMQVALLPISEALLALASQVMPQVIAGVTVVSEAISAFVAVLMNLFNSTNQGTSDMASGWQAATDLIMAVIGVFSAFWQEHGTTIIAKAAEIGAKFGEIFGLIVEIISTLVTPAIQGLTAFWQEHGDLVVQYISNAMTLLGNVIMTALDLISGILQTTLALMQGDWQGAWEAMQATVVTLTTNILLVIQSAFNLMVSAVQVALAAIGISFDDLVVIGQVAADAFYDVFVQPILDGFAAIQNMIANVTGVFNNFVDGITNFEMPSFELPEIEVPEFQLPEFFGGARAAGGPVSAGRSYLVGEQGPEMFVPSSSGDIIPSAPTAAMMGGGGVNVGGINVTIQGAVVDNAARLQEMVDMIAGKVQGAVWQTISTALDDVDMQGVL